MIAPATDSIAVNPPNLFIYLDYRKFLKDVYTYKKLKSRAFSYRTFSKCAGFRSPNILKLVIDGQRNLSPKTAYQFAQGLKLSEQEAQFFIELVLFNQSKTIEEKRHHYEQIMRSGAYNKAKPLDKGQYAYFSNWYLVALRELVTVKGFKENWLWINRKLGIRLTAREINDGIKLLLDLGLLRRGEKGRLAQTDGHVQSESALSEVNFVNFHRQMIRRAEESIEKSDVDCRDLSGLTFSLNRKQFEQIKKEIGLFRSRVSQVVSEVQDPEAVYQLNFQLFNLSEVQWK